MKKYNIGIIIITVIAICCLTGKLYLDSFYMVTTQYVDESEQTLNTGNYEGAAEAAENLKSHLENVDFILRMYITHEEIDLILASAARMTAYAKEETKNDYLAECQNIREKLKAIVSSEEISIENVF